MIRIEYHRIVRIDPDIVIQLASVVPKPSPHAPAGASSFYVPPSKALGPYHLDVAVSLNSLASLYRFQVGVVAPGAAHLRQADTGDAAIPRDRAEG